VSIFAAEFVGTFLLTFVGAGVILQTTSLGADGFGLLGVALANGVILSIAVTAAMNVSGAHFNPAVTIALIVCGKCRPLSAPLYVAAQILGAWFAALLLTAMFSAEVVSLARLGTPAPAPGVTWGTLLLVEIVLTFVLAIAIWGTAVDSRSPNVGGFGIGLAVFCDILVGGPISGAAMNPARVLGPALVGGVWDMHAAYWIGPVIGAVLGSVFYKTLIYRD
jgi:aquaporin Z